jgi:dipeptidyl aminopeptidase/acylaminoacyl peptidase
VIYGAAARSLACQRLSSSGILRALLIVASIALLAVGGVSRVRGTANERFSGLNKEQIPGKIVSSEGSRGSKFEVENYAHLRQFEDLQISPDGGFVVYVTRPLLKDNSENGGEAFVLSTTEGAKPIPLVGLPATARGIRWAGNSRLLVFLADVHDVAQVYIYNWEKRELSRMSDSEDSVVAFELSSSGKYLAYVTRPKPNEAASLYTSLRRSGPGILIDTDAVSLYDVMDPHFAQRVHEPDASLWVSKIGKESRRIEVPGDPGSILSEIHWSDDDSLISIVYLADNVPQGSTRPLRTSLGVVFVETGEFRDIGRAFGTTSTAFGQSFRGGDWIPRQHRLVVRRTIIKDLWSLDYPEWAISTPRSLKDQRDLRWHAVQSRFDVKMHPITPHLLLVENTLGAVGSLYEWSDAGVRRSEIVSQVDGESSKFSFAQHAKAAAFINESMIRPPEIYFYHKGTIGSRVRRLSSVNERVAAKITGAISEVSWRSTDGTTIKGWLLEPVATRAKPWPVVTFLHGGPGAPITNRFAPYWPLWPYPFDVYVSSGIAVFFPNYRGSATFGLDFQKPKQLDGEPIDDVITGVEFLLDAGIADRSRLGLSGHSHGGWLGPMVLTRYPIFRACSFAEGWGNTIEAYELLNGLHLREVFDPMVGGSLYDVPVKYLKLSPDLHFGNVTSANLFESGSESGVLEMLSLGKASAAKGLPTESVVYPLTGHNPTSPKTQWDSAQRNADWFMFWLRDEERGNADAAAQYERWRAAKSHWLFRSNDRQQ